jgi:hypothetical protein
LFEEFWLAVDRYMDRSGGQKMPVYDYYKPRWSDAKWHGGVTWYEKKQVVDTDQRYVKIGCDYNHIWDDDSKAAYNENWIYQDCLKTSRMLAQLYKFKVRCGYSGHYFYPEYCVAHTLEVAGYSQKGFLSPAGAGDRSKWMRRERNTALKKLGLDHLCIELEVDTL